MEITKVTDLETLSNVESGTYTPVVDKNGNAKKVDLSGLQPQLKTINNESLLGSGNISIASGKGISGTGTNAEVFNDGDASQASGNASHAEGADTTASGWASHAEGQMTTASGYFSHAEGNESTASGESSHAEGNGNIASGEASHAEGADTTASGVASHSGGRSVNYQGETVNSEATGAASFAHGAGAKALANSTFAVGQLTKAQGLMSSAIGNGTLAQGRAEHAQGQYNVSNYANDGKGANWGNAGNTIHSVGIGTSDSARKNAFEIMQNGDVYVLGIGGYDGTNAGQSGVKTLQRVIYDLSSSEYDLEDLNLTAKGAGAFEAMFKTTDTTAITAIFSSPNTGDIIKVNLKGIQNGTTYSYEGNMTYNGSEYVSSDNKWTINSTAWVIVKL